MNEKEVGELRRRLRPEKNSITHIRGCYVNEMGESVAQFDQSLALMTQEETETLLALLRRTLSGTLGKNLLDLSFETRQVVEGEEHRRLMRLRDTALKDEEAVEEFFQLVRQSLTLEGNYLILLVYDRYDVPYRAKDGERQEDAAAEVYSYLLCSICPVKQTKPALSYHVRENEFHNRRADWLVSPPELGFLFPAFDDRSTNLYNALYYTRDSGENHPELVEEHRERKEAEPLTLSKGAVKCVLKSCGVSDSHVEEFALRYDDAFGADMALSPRNLVEKQIEVCTPDVVIKVSPERSDLVDTRVIDGVKYILIRADEGVEVNGVPVHIAE